MPDTGTMQTTILRRTMDMTVNEMLREFNDELLRTERPGIKDLIEFMEVGGFYVAPCSGAHHLAKESGLLEHSLNVLNIARKLNSALEAGIKDDTIIITALLHDAGKMGDHGKFNYIENLLKDGKQSTAKPYVTNPSLLYIPHEVRSVMIAERFICLYEDEEQAILWHNGLYGAFKYDIQSKETPLYMVLHWADMWASRVTEIEED